MKKLLLLFALLIFACSSDSSDTNDNPQNDSIIGTWKYYNIQAFNQNDELLMDFISGTDIFHMSDCQFNSDYVEFTDSTFTSYTFFDDFADCQNGDNMIVDGCTNVYIDTGSYNLNNSMFNYSDYITENLICNETSELQDASVPFIIENDQLKLYYLSQTAPAQQILFFDEPHYFVFTYQRQ
jgi:hypothetical protein